MYCSSKLRALNSSTKTGPVRAHGSASRAGRGESITAATVQVAVPASDCARDTAKRTETEAPLLAQRRYTLEELVARITPENRHEEIDWGPPVGNEVW